MNPCRQCGADLPDNAKFCMQCGAPVDAPEVRPPVPQPALDFVQPALTGGMFLGLFSSIPFISAGNFLCCMWVVAGGGIAAFVLTKQRPTGITYGDGAFAGVLSGLFGAIIATLLSIPVRVLSARMLESQQQAVEDLLQQAGAEGPFRDLMMRLLSPEISLVTVLFTFFMNLLVFALFAMIGGILMVAILNKRRMRPPMTRMPH